MSDVLLGVTGGGPNLKRSGHLGIAGADAKNISHL